MATESNIATPPTRANAQNDKAQTSSSKYQHSEQLNPITFLRRFVSTKKPSSASTGSSSLKDDARRTDVDSKAREGEKETTERDLAFSYEDISSSRYAAELGEGSSGGRTGKSGASSVPLTTLVKSKLMALEKLRKFGGGSKASSSGKGGKDKRNAEFPPSSWNVDEETGLSADVDGDVAEAQGEEGEGEGATGKFDEGGIIPDAVEDAAGASADEVSHTSAPPESPESDRTEPDSLARRIQLLLSSMPRLSFSAAAPPSPGLPAPSSTAPPLSKNEPTTSLSDTSPGGENVATTTSFPEPNPASGALIDDSKLISQLSSASVMNGSISKGRESVWTILDRLGWSRAAANATTTSRLDVPKGKERAVDGQDENDDLRKVGEGDRALPGSENVMLYAPLEPDDESVVEIARSEVVEVSDDEERTAVKGESSSAAEGTAADVISTGDTGAADELKATTEKPKPVREKVIWVPSTTKISVQVTWWGYRIYLPPPVLRVLNSRSMEAAKRATLITTALKWTLDHIPTTFLPLQVRPAAMLLRRLVPLLGYLGAFIAWSWGAVKTFDRGYGVILSATWLLPVAVIPGAWDEGEFMKIVMGEGRGENGQGVQAPPPPPPPAQK